jgi:hypothetical protein
MTELGFLEFLRRKSPVLSRAFAYFTAVTMGAPVIYHVLRGSRAYLGLFEDDFFYYAVIADHLVTLGRLTFDGVTLTNGFHPLWFIVIVALRLLTGGLGAAFFGALSIVLIALIAATYEAFRVLAERLGASPSLAAPIAALQVASIGWLVTTGMEVALAVPLYAWLLAELARGGTLTPSRAAKLGLLSSLAILARLDLALAVAFLLLGAPVIFRNRAPNPLRSALMFCVGGAATAAYFAANWLAFGALLPISGQAKQFEVTRHLNIPFLRQVLSTFAWQGALLVAGGIALVSLWRRKPNERLEARVVALVVLAFPVCFYALNAIQCAWSFFAWYAYPVGPAVIAACVLVLEWSQGLLARRGVAVVSALALALGVIITPIKGARFFVAQGLRWTTADNSLTAMATQLADELRDRSGRFAMGDKAGISTFLLRKPVVQLEGLVADTAMLDYIKNQASLNDVVKHYGVDYLVVSVGRTRVAQRNGCYFVVIPNPDQANDASEMSGTFCLKPIVHFETPQGKNRWSRYLPLETYVFDLRDSTRQTLR